MDDIQFYKMSGSGNDFIVIDNRRNQMGSVQRREFAQRVCKRRMSVGADGLIIIETSNDADFKWHFLNADGSDATMCGNGARCAARFACLTGLDDLEAAPVDTLGRLIRYHQQYAPEGTNVNFIQHRADGTVAMRTYERGVEAETLACGTGAVAGAIIASRLFDLDSPVRMIVRSGLPLDISFCNNENAYQNVYLKGEARIIYHGRLGKEA